jgi:hypothetical protein
LSAEQWAYGPFDTLEEAQVFSQAYAKYYNDCVGLRSVVYMWNPEFADIPEGFLHP